MKLRRYWIVLFALLLIVGGYLLGAMFARESLQNMEDSEFVDN